jgi:hypothetical protein
MSFKAPRLAQTKPKTKPTNKTRRTAKKPKRFINTESPPKENTGVSAVPEFLTQAIPGMTTQPDLEDSLLQEEQSSLTDNVIDTGDDQMLNGRTPPLWSTMAPPRLLATDSPQHVQLAVTTNFGAGVDMDKYLGPARTLFDRFSQPEKDEYKKKGLTVLKIPASWRKWNAMETAQKIRFINALHVLSPRHAVLLETNVEEIAWSARQETDETINTNRTMHEYARVMHIMSSSDNMAAISRALGRYNRLELDESRSKLHEDLQFSVSGWKQLAIVFNDPQVMSNCV